MFQQANLAIPAWAIYNRLNWFDLLLIQCGIGKPTTVPWQWQHHEYILRVKREKQRRLPAEKVQMGNQDVAAPARTMWEWHFAIEPLEADNNSKKYEQAFTSLIYDSADSISSFYLWNESGYGSHADEQHAHRSPPLYRTQDSIKDEVTGKWKRF